jgi:hypothetical protein
MRGVLLGVAMLAAVAPAALRAKDVQVDFTKPESVVEAIFAAARSHKFGVLGGLCDPMKENDSDTQKICDVSKAGRESREEFVKVFRTGRIRTPGHIDGEMAEVRFEFGPDGSRVETMRLILRDGKWYLSSF